MLQSALQKVSKPANTGHCYYYSVLSRDGLSGVSYEDVTSVMTICLSNFLVRTNRAFIGRPKSKMLYLVGTLLVGEDSLFGDPGAHFDEVDLDAFDGRRDFAAEEEAGAGVELDRVLRKRKFGSKLIFKFIIEKWPNVGFTKTRRVVEPPLIKFTASTTKPKLT